MNTQSEFQCCFCGERINEGRWDPGVLAYTPSFEKEDEEITQALYCHRACLQDRLHGSVKLFE